MPINEDRLSAPMVLLLQNKRADAARVHVALILPVCPHHALVSSGRCSFHSVRITL